MSSTLVLIKNNSKHISFLIGIVIFLCATDRLTSAYFVGNIKEIFQALLTILLFSMAVGSNFLKFRYSGWGYIFLFASICGVDIFRNGVTVDLLIVVLSGIVFITLHAWPSPINLLPIFYFGVTFLCSAVILNTTASFIELIGGRPRALFFQDELVFLVALIVSAISLTNLSKTFRFFTFLLCGLNFIFVDTLNLVLSYLFFIVLLFALKSRINLFLGCGLLITVCFVLIALSSSHVDLGALDSIVARLALNIRAICEASNLILGEGFDRSLYQVTEIAGCGTGKILDWVLNLRESYRVVFEYYRYFEHDPRMTSHNTWIDILVQTGVVGGLLIILLTRGLISHFIFLRKVKSSEVIANEAPFLAVVCAFVLAFFFLSWQRYVFELAIVFGIYFNAKRMNQKTRFIVV